MRSDRTRPGDNTLGCNIRRLRSAKKLTQEELAERAGISSVKMIEKRGAGRVDSLQKIAVALGVPMTELFKGAETGMPQELVQFLESPMARTVTDEEVGQLRQLAIPGKRLTPEAYHLALLMLRAAEDAVD